MVSPYEGKNEYHKEYCSACRKRLFDGRRVSPVLPFSRPEYNDYRIEHGDRLSISGVQSKYSLRLTGSDLELTETGGQYILKPFVPGEFRHMEALPANEHITMQLAGQIVGLDTAADRQRCGARLRRLRGRGTIPGTGIP